MDATTRGRVIGLQIADTSDKGIEPRPWLRSPPRKPKHGSINRPIPREVQAAFSRRLYVEKAGLPSSIYQARCSKRFELVASEWQLDELRRVSRYSKLPCCLKPTEAGNLVSGLRPRATILEALANAEVSPDPDDDPVLAMAEASQAKYLVTGDRKRLLALGTIGGTHMVSARQFCGK
jgi:putative PIN family toxin of toxin-antitoxin system